MYVSMYLCMYVCMYIYIYTGNTLYIHVYIRVLRDVNYLLVLSPEAMYLSLPFIVPRCAVCKRPNGGRGGSLAWVVGFQLAWT